MSKDDGLPDELDPDDLDDPDGDDDEEGAEGEALDTQDEVLDALEDLIDTLDEHRQAVMDNTKALRRIGKILSGAKISEELMGKIPAVLEFIATMRNRKRNSS